MKKILLLLLFVVTGMKADNALLTTDLENAIIKSDLLAVKKLLSSDILISGDEKIALLNLASEIIKKRENKVLVNTVVNRIELSNKRYSEEIYALKKYDYGALAFALTAVSAPIILVAGITTCSNYLRSISHLTERELENIGGISATAISIVSFGAALYNLVKYGSLAQKLIREHDARSKSHYDNAIQIRYLLYKIKTW